MTLEELKENYNLSFFDLMHKAHLIHRENNDHNKIQGCKLVSIKQGGCPEDCKYCTQSAFYKTDTKKIPFSDSREILDKAIVQAKNQNATRLCMGAAWRNLNNRDMPKIIDHIKYVKSHGFETCVTLGMITESQAKELKDAGLEYYNHNVDTSPEFYDKIITTRTFKDRLDTLKHVRDAGINVCTGGILGLGESVDDRLSMLEVLSNLDPYPESVPINKLIPMPGTPLADQLSISSFDLVRIIAVTRISMPKTSVRLSAGRNEMSQELQAMCFFVGANSIFVGDKYLTEESKLPGIDLDQKLINELGISWAV
jgi:biotin synthase